MNKIFTPKFIASILLQVVLLGGVVFFIQKYFENKWAPLTAEETLRRENFLNAKRDTYFQAIDILNRALANSEFTENGKPADLSHRNRGGKYPTELEVNSCFSKLCIYSSNKEILKTYRKLFDTSDKQLKPILEMGNFINLLRKDLGYENVIVDPYQNEYQFIQIRRKYIP
ncbi:MAG: hypothetical protein HZB33_10425 [Nitrospirae bacterium]|nr:hypothetical protein [Nitrospirota bacterium]